MCTTCIHHDIGGCLSACLPVGPCLGPFEQWEAVAHPHTHTEPHPLTLPHTPQQYKESEMGQLSGWHASSVGEETETPEVRDVTSTPQVGYKEWVCM